MFCCTPASSLPGAPVPCGSVRHFESTSAFAEEPPGAINFILRPTNIFMEQKSKLSFTVRSEDEGGFSAQCIEFPGIVTQAETESELTEMMTDAVNGYFESFPEEKEMLQNTRKNKVIEISV